MKWMNNKIIVISKQMLKHFSKRYTNTSWTTDNVLTSNEINKKNRESNISQKYFLPNGSRNRVDNNEIRATIWHTPDCITNENIKIVKDLKGLSNTVLLSQGLMAVLSATRKELSVSYILSPS